jgi:hypothetical protein
MTTYNFTIDLNAPCTACGKPGRVVENAAGLCLTCIEKSLGDAAPATGRLRLDRTQRPDGRGLAGSLFDLILRAERARDQKFHSLPLQHGLFVEIGLGEYFNLRMYRRDCTPSSREWQTVVDYLPAAYQPAQAVQPRDFKHTSRDHLMRWYLEAHWPIKQT